VAEQPWFPFFWKDWLASTRGMSAEAKGVYIDFLAMEARLAAA
jgi:hypothetical protein